ncbi:uncharacterized protein LOC144096611 [Amblyomma americanum]
MLGNYGTMTRAMISFKNCHAATRVKIENAFGMLKQRFWQLRFVEFHTVDKITQLILSCCVLHNICLDAGDCDVPSDDDMDGRHCRHKQGDSATDQQTQQTAHESALRRLGELKRDALAQLF